MGGRLVILAGGISSRMKKKTGSEKNLDPRLKEEADNKSKSMIGVGKNYRPFLDYLLFNAKEAGYQDVVIVVGEKDYSIRSYFGTKERGNSFHGLQISYATQFIPAGRKKPLGTADALLQALYFRKDWRGKKFTVCNSDNLYSKHALRLLLNTEQKNAMINYDRSALLFEQNRIVKFAVIKQSKDGFLQEIIEKPTAAEIESAKNDDGMIGVSMNIFCLDYDMIVPFLEKVPLHPQRKEKELPAAVGVMVKEYPRSVYMYPLSEHVPDLTNRDDIQRVSNYLQDKFENIAFGN